MMWLSGHLPCDGAFLNQFLRFVVYRELWTSLRLLIFSALLIDEWGCGLPPLAANFLVFVGFCWFFFVTEFCGFFWSFFLIRCFCVLRIFFHHLLYFVEEEDPDFFLVMMAFIKFLKLIWVLNSGWVWEKDGTAWRLAVSEYFVKEVSDVVDPSIPPSWLRGLTPFGSTEMWSRLDLSCCRLLSGLKVWLVFPDHFDLRKWRCDMWTGNWECDMFSQEGCHLLLACLWRLVVVVLRLCHRTD